MTSLIFHMHVCPSYRFVDGRQHTNVPKMQQITSSLVQPPRIRSHTSLPGTCALISVVDLLLIATLSFKNEPGAVHKLSSSINTRLPAAHTNRTVCTTSCFNIYSLKLTSVQQLHLLNYQKVFYFISNYVCITFQSLFMEAYFCHRIKICIYFSEFRVFPPEFSLYILQFSFLFLARNNSDFFFLRI